MSRDVHGAVLPAGLVADREQVRDELRRADVKATTLLSLVAAALAWVIALTGRPLPTPAHVALWVSAAPILASVLLLAAIRPRLTDQPARGSWLHAVQTGPASLLDTYARTEESALAAAHDVCDLAAIAHAKYRHIQTSLTALVIGIGVLTVALVLSVITR